MVFRSGKRDHYTWDDARLLESVKIHLSAAREFLRFPKIFATSRVHGSRYRIYGKWRILFLFLHF